MSQAFALQIAPAGKVAFISASAVVKPQLFDCCSDALALMRQRRSRPTVSPITSASAVRGDTATADTQCYIVTISPFRSNVATAVVVASAGSAVHQALLSPFVAPLLALLGAAVLEGADLVGANRAAGTDVLLCLTSPVAFALSSWRSERAGKHAAYDVDVCSLIVLLVVALMSVASIFFTTRQ